MPDLFIGTLSGTSVDGIDAALVRFAPGPALVASHSLKFPEDLRRELLALGVPGANEIDRLGRADVRLGRLFAQAVNGLLQHAGIAPREIAAIGSHGQTIRHRPGGEAPFTLQIGDPSIIATDTGIPVVADFRRKDMALGGQGAPLVPAFHEAVFRQPGADRVIVNIGGIANLTVLPGDAARPLLGFDTGPGNTLLDGWCRRCLNEPMDRDGAFAASGRPHPVLLAALLGDAYFKQTPPKSTGPEYFSTDWLQRHLDTLGPLAPADVQATLLELTARSIAEAIRHLPGLAAAGCFPVRRRRPQWRAGDSAAEAPAGLARGRDRHPGGGRRLGGGHGLRLARAAAPAGAGRQLPARHRRHPARRARRPVAAGLSVEHLQNL
jgi:anhydro-N-acetylmuramic acid kinase